MTARLCSALLMLLFLNSCASLGRLAKAGPSEPSEFLEHRAELKKTTSGRSPFLQAWRNPDRQVLEKASKRKTLYIAPVSLDYLRKMTKPMSVVEVREKSRQKEAHKLAEYAKQEFAKAFHASPNPRYRIVDKQEKDSLILSLAFTDFNPNSIVAGVTRRSINLLLVPGAEAVVGRPLKGNISIEGRVYDPVQKQSLYEFADTEQNKSALILSIHDYNPYSAARKIIREWASQFEQVTRAPIDGEVEDSAPFTLWFW